MRLLADQDVYAATVKFLRELGHDVVTVAEIGMSQASDAEILKSARASGRLLLTRNRDYGGLVFMQSMGSGVLYLRIVPSNLRAVHEELQRVLEIHAAEALQQAFVVIEPGRHRIRASVRDPDSSD